MQGVNPPVQQKKYTMCNLIIQKMVKKTSGMERASDAATYQGVMNKTLYFLALCFVGLIAFFPLHNLLLQNAGAYGGAIVLNNIEGLEGIFSIETCAIEALLFAVAGIIVLFTPLIAWLIRPAIPVVGTLYALCEGYFAGMITASLTAQYKWIPLVAFLLTAMVVAAMLLLYVKRIVKVTDKFKKVILTLFIASIASGVIIFLLNFIPALQPIIQGMTSFMNSPVYGIVSSIVFIVIAALFLLFDFDAIESCVEKKMPRKMEWMASFGLVYTIIYIYFKILGLILQIVAQSKND